MKRLVVAGLLLFCAGCTSSQSYAQRLSLPELPAPNVLVAPSTLESPGGASSEVSVAVDGIRIALTSSQVDEVTSRIRSSGLASGMAVTESSAGSPEATEQIKACLQFLDQAAQIKKAQIENGDAGDSTGEVEERLKSARQLALNADELRKNVSNQPATLK